MFWMSLLNERKKKKRGKKSMLYKKAIKSDTCKILSVLLTLSKVIQPSLQLLSVVAIIDRLIHVRCYGR